MADTSEIKLFETDELPAGFADTSVDQKKTLKIHFFKVYVEGYYDNPQEAMIESLRDITRQQASRSKTIKYSRNKRMGFNIGFIKEHSLEEICTFLFFRSKLFAGDQSLINLVTFNVESMDRRLRLDDDEGIGKYAMCAFDYRNSVIAVQTVQSPNKIDLENYLAARIGRKVSLVFMVDTEAEKILQRMTIKKFSMQVAIPKLDRLAPLYGGTVKEQMEVGSALLEYAEKFDGDMISMEVSAGIGIDLDGVKRQINKDAVIKERNSLRKMIERKIVQKKKPRAVATGTVKMDDNKIINNRAIDLIDEFLIWQDDVRLPSNIDDAMKTLGEIMTRVIKETRGSYERVRN